jgi:hypothetical protein
VALQAVIHSGEMLVGERQFPRGKLGRRDMGRANPDERRGHYALESHGVETLEPRVTMTSFSTVSMSNYPCPGGIRPLICRAHSPIVRSELNKKVELASKMSIHALPDLSLHTFPSIHAGVSDAKYLAACRKMGTYRAIL